MTEIYYDPYLTIQTVAKTERPDIAIYTAMRQDYSGDFVGDKYANSETNYSQFIIKHLLAGKRGHYGPTEHPSITFAIGYFPHDVMVQARTHRINVSFDVSSLRWCSNHILQAADGQIPLEKVFYVRPIGFYKDPNTGETYEYCEKERRDDLDFVALCANKYAKSVRSGMPGEQARQVYLPQGIRQHFVVSFNLRSLWHFLDLRAKPDAQLEIQTLANGLLKASREWCPELMDWYEQNRLAKGILAP